MSENNGSAHQTTVDLPRSIQEGARQLVEQGEELIASLNECAPAEGEWLLLVDAPDELFDEWAAAAVKTSDEAGQHIYDLEKRVQKKVRPLQKRLYRTLDETEVVVHKVEEEEEPRTKLARTWQLLNDWNRRIADYEEVLLRQLYALARRIVASAEAFNKHLEWRPGDYQSQIIKLIKERGLVEAEAALRFAEDEYELQERIYQHALEEAKEWDLDKEQTSRHTRLHRDTATYWMLRAQSIRTTCMLYVQAGFRLPDPNLIGTIQRLKDEKDDLSDFEKMKARAAIIRVQLPKEAEIPQRYIDRKMTLWEEAQETALDTNPDCIAGREKGTFMDASNLRRTIERYVQKHPELDHLNLEHIRDWAWSYFS